VIQDFRQEGGRGQALVYAQYSDNTLRDVSEYAMLESLATDTFNVSGPTNGFFDISVRTIHWPVWYLSGRSLRSAF
jgi:hypothetical protein